MTERVVFDVGTGEQVTEQMTAAEIAERVASAEVQAQAAAAEEAMRARLKQLWQAANDTTLTAAQRQAALTKLVGWTIRALIGVADPTQ